MQVFTCLFYFFKNLFLPIAHTLFLSKAHCFKGAFTNRIYLTDSNAFCHLFISYYNMEAFGAIVII